MLVLSRKQGESVCVGDNVRITILTVCGDRVRIGVEAPRDVTVHREEVLAAIARSQAENLAGPGPAASASD